ncbi:MAG: sirohydrochlorin chelatase [Gemmatimonadaceae bacterium]
MPHTVRTVLLRRAGTIAAAVAIVLPAGGLGAQQHPAGHTMPAPAAAPSAPAAPATSAAKAEKAVKGKLVVGTMIIAHGGGPSWNAQVDELASRVKSDGPVTVSYLMGPGAKTHAFQVAARELVEKGATAITVVPLLVSSHSGHYDQIRYLVGQLDTLSDVMHHHLEMGGITRADVDVPIRLSRAVDASPDAARVLAERAKALVPDAADRSKRALFLLGHGPNSAEDYASWMTNLRQVADTVRAATGFRSVLLELVRDDAPAEVRAEAVTRARELIQLQHDLTGQPVAVVPILVSTGQVSQEKFPKDLDGLPVIYRGEGLLPHPGMARWVEARVRESWPAAGQAAQEDAAPSPIRP